jgi:hypothetical protein
MIGGLINLIIWLLIIGILVSLAFWVLTQVPGIPEPIVRLIRIVIIVVVVLVIVLLLLQLVGSGGSINLPKLT